MIVFTISGLYVSSLCASGIQALLIAVAATPALTLFIQTVLVPLGSAVFASTSGGAPGLGIKPGDWRVPAAVPVLLGAGFLAVVLRFAMVNHRSAERGARHVVTQIVWMAVLLTIGVTLWAALAGQGTLFPS
jgi:hypothetical protein